MTFINDQRYVKQNHIKACQPKRMDVAKGLNIINMMKIQRKDNTCILNLEMFTNRATKEISKKIHQKFQNGITTIGLISITNGISVPNTLDFYNYCGDIHDSQ